MLYNKHVKFREFKKGELVLSVAMDVRKETDAGKMAESLERPYQIRKALGKRAYKLQTQDGTLLP